MTTKISIKALLGIWGLKDAANESEWGLNNPNVALQGRKYIRQLCQDWAGPLMPIEKFAMAFKGLDDRFQLLAMGWRVSLSFLIIQAGLIHPQRI